MSKPSKSSQANWQIKIQESEKRLQGRLVARLARVASESGLTVDEAQVHRCAALVQTQIQRVAKAIFKDDGERYATLDRQALIDSWPFMSGIHDGDPKDASVVRHIDQFVMRSGRSAWPSGVAFADVITALVATKDPGAVYVAGLMQQSKFQILNVKLSLETPSFSFFTFEFERKFINDPVAKTVVPAPDDIFDRERELWKSEWWPPAVAILLLIHGIVKKDLEYPAAAMSAHTPNRTVVHMAAVPPSSRAGKALWKSEGIVESDKTSYCLSWNGRKDEVQLRLNLDEGYTLDSRLLRSINERLTPDGGRDWAMYHLLAHEHGRKHIFRWNTEEHLERAGYMRRVKSRTNSKEDERQRLVTRARHMKGAELWFQNLTETADGVKKKQTIRVGDWGLIDIPAWESEKTAKDVDYRPTVAILKINQAIYRGAEAASDTYCTLIPEKAISELESDELNLFMLIAFGWRYSKDSRKLSIQANTLWEYAGISEGVWEKRKRWSDAKRMLEKKLVRIGKPVAGWNWTSEGEGAEALYQFPHPSWWLDRVDYGLSPSFRPNVTGTPRTGKELSEWLKSTGLSLRLAGELLGVHFTKVQRANSPKKADAPLPHEWSRKIAEANAKPGSVVSKL